MVVSRRQDNAQRIAALDTKAEALKLRIGQGIAEARAMHPDLDIVEEDVEGDRRLLDALADWCDRYTPLVAMDWPDGLYLDITGCAHLFGGEVALMEDARRRLREQGFDVRGGLAATPGTAYALARFDSGAIIEQGDEAQALAPFPLSALRIAPDTRHGLESVGLRVVGAVMAAPRAPLAKRFGKELLLRIDQAVGRVEESITPRRPVPDLSVERRFFEPIGTIEDIEQLVLTLSTTLQPALAQRGEGATALELALFRVDGTVFRLRVRTARPLRDPKLIRILFREKLSATSESLDPGYGFDLLRLSVLTAQPFAEVQSDLMKEGDEEVQTIALLADRVEARLGRQVVVHPVEIASHIPERAIAYAPGAATPVDEEDDVQPASTFTRPLRLLRQPEPVDVTAEVPEGPPAHFRWRRMHHRIVRAEGPERMIPEWWHDEKGETRDYFRVEDGEGHRYWLFRQGLYEGEPRLAPLMKEKMEEEERRRTGKSIKAEDPNPAKDEDDDSLPAAPPPMPRWYMHGIFA
nr:DNA polymerase Y family protein [Tianweitania aestuarii]